MAEETQPKTFDIEVPKKAETGLPPELAKKVARAEKRLDAKPDAPADAKKSDVAIPMDALPQEVEAELKAFSKITSRGSKAFDLMVTKYLADNTDAYGISKDPSKIVNGLEKEMIKAYGTAFGMSAELLSELESSLILGGAKEGGPGAALARDFRRVTGFDYEFKEGLAEQKTIDYQQVKDQVLERASKSLFGNLRADSIAKFASTVTNDNWREFRGVPLLMAKKLGLEDQIDQDRLAHRNDIVSVYGNLFGNYAQRFRTKYLN